MINNLAEAIAQERKEIENLKEIASTIPVEAEYYKSILAEYLECIAKHEQLASWLEELRERRDAVKKLEESAEYYKDSLFSDGICFALKVISEPKKKD